MGRGARVKECGTKITTQAPTNPTTQPLCTKARQFIHVQSKGVDSKVVGVKMGHVGVVDEKKTKATHLLCI